MNSIVPNRTAWVLSLAMSLSAIPGGGATGHQSSPKQPPKKFEVLTLRGRVVWLAEAMARRHGVKTVPEAAMRVLALETSDGQLFPLAEDIRGRGFRRDERLRKVDLELLVRRYHGAPVIQVIRAFELTKKAKFELDYWCEICAIAMFELKPCDCCQADIQLRRRIVDKDGRTTD
jgi:hypothetical protein